MNFNGSIAGSGCPDLSGDVVIGRDLKVNGVILASDGSDSAPSFSFQNEPGTGWERSGTGEVSYVSSGSKRMRL